MIQMHRWYLMIHRLTQMKLCYISDRLRSIMYILHINIQFKTIGKNLLDLHVITFGST